VTTGVVGTAPEIADVRPTPTDEEMAAIVAAIAMTWPQPTPVVEQPVPTTPAWRFSGRWWARPVAARRDRPW
jgi:hypothetical protein